MQTQCALSIMESEYLAHSQAICNLIPLREILKEIMEMVFQNNQAIPRCTANSKVFSNVTSDESESPLHKSKVYEDNHACLKFASSLKEWRYPFFMS